MPGSGVALEGGAAAAAAGTMAGTTEGLGTGAAGLAEGAAGTGAELNLSAIGNVADVDAAATLDAIPTEGAGSALTELAGGAGSGVPSEGAPTAIGASPGPEGSGGPPEHAGDLLQRPGATQYTDVTKDALATAPPGGQPPEGSVATGAGAEPPAPGGDSAASQASPGAESQSGTLPSQFGTEQQARLTELRSVVNPTLEQQAELSTLAASEQAASNARTAADEAASKARVLNDSGNETQSPTSDQATTGPEAPTTGAQTPATPEPSPASASLNDSEKARLESLKSQIDLTPEQVIDRDNLRARESTSAATTEATQQTTAELTAQRDAALEELRNNPSAEKLQRVEDLNGKINESETQPDALKQSGIDKLSRGEPITDEERAALSGETPQDTTEDESIPDAEGQETPEQIAQSFDDIQEDALRKMEDGDLEGMREAMLAYNERLAQMQGYSMTEADKAKASELINGIFKPEGLGGRESNRYRHIREKLQELGRLEMQVHQLAKAVAKMEDNERKMKDQVNVAENNYVSESNPTEKAKKYQLFAVTSLRLAQYQENMRQQKGRGRDLSLKRRQVRGYVHRKLGTKSAVYNVMFGTGTAMMQGAYAGAGAAGSVNEAIFDR